MACAIGQYYNYAYMAPERNGVGAGTLAKMMELRYPNLYYDIIQNPKKPEPGWWTSDTSRDLMLRTLRESIFEHSFVTHSLVLVLEMGALTWSRVKIGKWRAEAKTGAHDDVLISIAGALCIAPYAPTRSVIQVQRGSYGRPGQGGPLPFMR